MRGDQLRIETEFEVTQDVPGLDLAVLVTTSGGVRVIDELLSERSSARLSPGRYRVSLVLPAPAQRRWTTPQACGSAPLTRSCSISPMAAPFTVHGSDLQRPERILVLDLPLTLERLDAAW